MTDANAVDGRRLIARLGSGPELGLCRGFLITTYEFQPEFFETDFLPSLFGLGSWNNYHWSSRIALERHLLGARSALFMDSDTYRTRPRSLRVDILPGRGLKGRRLHAKISVFRHELGVRLLLGSANATEPGYRSNVEVATVLESTEKSIGDAAVMLQGLVSAGEVLQPWLDRAGQSFLDEVCTWLRDRAGKSSPTTDAICWGGGGRPLWEQIVDSWPKDDRIHTIRIVSPFWSEEKGNGPLFRLIRCLRERGLVEDTVSVELTTSAHPVSATAWRPILPQSLGNADYASIGVRAVAFPIDPRVSAAEIQVEGFEGKRELHAKAALFEGQKHTLASLGSANFTHRGWGFDGDRANIEAMLVLVRRGRDRGELQTLIPKPAGEGVVLGQAEKDDLADPPAITPPLPWPHFITDIRLSPSAADRDRLDLLVRVVAEDAPTDWSITIKGDGIWSRTGKQPQAPVMRCALDDRLLALLLKEQEVTISWPGNPTGCQYPINVEDEAKDQLPISPDSTVPTEGMLLAYYQGRIEFQDLFPPPDETGNGTDGGGQRADGSEVDTSRIQSYQIREFVESLDGIRADLRQASASERSMQLAFLGPVSPVALARIVFEQVRQGKRTPTGGAFQLVELRSCIEECRGLPNMDAWKSHLEAALKKVDEYLSALKSDHAELRRGTFRKYESMPRQSLVSKAK